TLEWFTVALATPGFGFSVWTSFWIGLAATATALAIVTLFLAGWWGTRPFAFVSKLTAPLLAVPHAAVAFGLAFLVLPSGWFVRLFSPWATGFDRPPDWLIVNDPAGYTLYFGLVIKEVPFLFLMALAALSQVGASRRLRTARMLGYGRVWGWMGAVFPAVYAQIRLPVYAVIAFAGSVVDMAMIIGPLTPPTLAVQVLRMSSDPDLNMKFAASAAALVQLGVTVFSLLVWWCGEKLVARLGRHLLMNGQRLRADVGVRIGGAVLMAVPALMIMLGIVALTLSSVSLVWRFPDAFPAEFTFDHWARVVPGLAEPVLNTVVIGLGATAIALVLVLSSLENGFRNHLDLRGRALGLIYVPLIMPQIAFLLGLLIVALWVGAEGSVWAVTFTHLVFVLPYVYLSLADPYQNFDPRYLRIAAALGKTPWQAFFTVRVPMMLRPILVAAALGFAISVAQYLPTILIGGGRVPTVTTEAVALASGGDRRLIGVVAQIQTLLVVVGFVVAAIVPALVFRQRRLMQISETER
ncbi:MAG: ABC transporter permease subunit, partial [Alphaproteobacteria bacterium]|nr:ABC transporter permease subunit [Alphaproteobacteria bacterium]